MGLGAVLLQEVEGEMKPVAYLSRRLLDRETRYSTVEKECLAMKWAIDTLRYYLLGRHFILETDHRALQWLNRMRDANMRIAGWYLALQPYDFTVRYRSGRSNVVADCLSWAGSIECSIMSQLTINPPPPPLRDLPDSVGTNDDKSS